MINNRYFTLIFSVIPITWAGSFIAAKYVVQDISAIESVFMRFWLSTVVMLPWLFYTRRRVHPSFKNIRFIRHLAIVVLTSGIGYHIPFFAALKYTSPTNTALIIALNPFITAIVEKILNRQHRPVRFYIGFILAFIGALWVIVSKGGGLNFNVIGKGEFYCLLATIFWSAYTLLSKYTKEPEWDSYWIGAYNYLFTAIFILPFVINIFFADFWINITISGWSGLVYMAIFPTAIGYTLYYIGVQKKGPAWAAAFIYLVPSITANLDYLFFDAFFTPALVIGTTIVVAGLFIGNVNSNQVFKIKGFFNRLFRN